MKEIKTIRLIINRQTIIVTLLAMLATYAARQLELTADFPLTLVGIAIVFPVVFSIGEAYKRREKALDQYAILKAHGRALFYASSDWIGDKSDKHDANLKNILKQMFSDITSYFHVVDKLKSLKLEKKVYKNFDDLSNFIEGMRQRGLSGSEVSRSNQYLSKMMTAFEGMKHIYQYRTPRTLRIYSKLFIYLLPIIYAPYFAYISLEYAKGLEYVMPILFSLVLVSLDNIQDHLENPYDQHGEDDVTFNADKFTENL